MSKDDAFLLALLDENDRMSEVQSSSHGYLSTFLRQAEFVCITYESHQRLYYFIFIWDILIK